MWLYSLYVAGVVIAFLLAPILDSIERKVKARLHSRVGPPILQTWYDILKLMRKELVIPASSYHISLVVLLSFGITGLLVVTLPHGIPATPFAGLDLLIIIVLITSLQALHIIAPVVSGNVFAVIGGFREFMLGIVNEVILVTALILLCALAGGLTLVSLSAASPAYGLSYVLTLILVAIASYVSSSRIPFDIAEAEPELASGVLVELSGPILGMALYSLLLKRYVLAALVSALITLPLVNALGYLTSFLVFLILTAFIWVLYSIVAIILSRSRVDLAVKGILAVYIPALLLTIISYSVGL